MRRNKGFTLIELMIVVAVIAILATMALFGLRRAQAAARDTARQAIMRGVQTALENYYGDMGQYPSSADFGTLMKVDLVTYLPTPPDDPKVGCDDAIAAGASWSPCVTLDGAGAKPVYAYTGGGQTYTLTLSKESGGTNTFSNPK